MAEPEANGDGVLRDTGAIEATRVSGAPIRPQSGSYVGRDADAPAVSKRDNRTERQSRMTQPSRDERRRRDERQTGSRSPAASRPQTRGRRQQDVAFAELDREEAPRRTRSPKQVTRSQPMRQPEDAKAVTRSQYAQRSQQGRRQESRRSDQAGEREMLAARMRRRTPRNQPSTEQQKQAQILD